LGILALLCATAGAQQPQQQQQQPQGECFTVVIPNGGDGGSVGSIKLNKCTGESWMLIRTSLGDGVTTLRWFPISVEKGEASSRVLQ
jgi:hypothetical protein